MRFLPILCPLLVVGCAAPSPVLVQAPLPPAQPAARPTKLVESRYEMGGYREAGAPDLRHEAHTVYRVSRVPAALSWDGEPAPSSKFDPISITPLPPSDELATELATQKSITAAMRAMQGSMGEMERKMQSQYALLLQQTEEAAKLRARLENQRQNHPTLVPPAPATAGEATEARW